MLRTLHRVGPLSALAILLVAVPASAWTDVSASASLKPRTGTTQDKPSRVLHSYSTVRNTSSAALNERLRLVIESPTLRVLNPDGTTGAHEPYFEIPALVPDAYLTVRIDFPLVGDPLEPLGYGLRLEQLLPPGQPLAITSAPVLTMDPYGAVPLAGRIDAQTNVPARATLHVSGPSSWTVAFQEHQTSHALPLLGLRPDSSYDVELEFTDAVGNSVMAPQVLQAVTPSLPADFPSIEVVVSDPARMEPGWVLTDSGTPAAYEMILDPAGNVVWYSLPLSADIEMLPNGNLFSRDGQEYTMLGQQVRQILFGASIHHDLFETERGTYLSLSRETVPIDDFPTSDTDPNAPRAMQNVRDEPVVEFAKDGTLLQSWPLRDILDPLRIGYNSLAGCANAEGCDWVHTNAVVHVPSDDSIIVSARHQDAVFKFSRVTGELKWILGPHDNWSPELQPYLLTPVGALEWQYHQHAPDPTPWGTLIMFDNGNERASPFDGMPRLAAADNYSRAVEYAVDEETMEVQQVWEFRFPHEERVFSRFISDADWTPTTGNVLIDFGGVNHMGGVPVPDLGYGTEVTRIVEVTHDTPAERVFDVILFDPASRVNTYRADKIPGLYPANVVVTDGISAPPPGPSDEGGAAPPSTCGLLGVEALVMLAPLARLRRRERAAGG